MTYAAASERRRISGYRFSPHNLCVYVRRFVACAEEEEEKIRDFKLLSFGTRQNKGRKMDSEDFTL